MEHSTSIGVELSMATFATCGVWRPHQTGVDAQVLDGEVMINKVDGGSRTRAAIELLPIKEMRGTMTRQGMHGAEKSDGNFL